MSARYVIAIGAQKCASSWLHAVLATATGVTAATEKEIDFFSYHFDRGYDWYAAQFAGDGQRFECSPSYFHDPRAPQRVFDFAPDARIIALLRDPVDRAYSNHLHEVVKGHIGQISFAEGLENNPSYLEQCRYSKHLSAWKALFGDQLLCLITEDVVTKPEAAMDAIMRHLNLKNPPTTSILQERRNQSDIAKHPILRQVLRKGGDTLRHFGMEEQLIKLKNLSPIRQMLKGNSVSLNGVVAPPTPEDVDFIIQNLSEDLSQLAPLLGRKSLPWASWEKAQNLRLAV